LQIFISSLPQALNLTWYRAGRNFLSMTLRHTSRAREGKWVFHVQNLQRALSGKKFDDLSDGIGIPSKHQFAVFEAASG
jgi:hypothetical protein